MNLIETFFEDNCFQLHFNEVAASNINYLSIIHSLSLHFNNSLEEKNVFVKRASS